MSERIILMYISEVSGHHSATIAIEKAIRSISPCAEILNINAFKYTNPISEKIINRLYTRVIKTMPKVWDYLYDNPKVAARLAKIKETIHKFNSPKLKILFDRFKPQAVICTQAFPCGMVADFKKSYASNLPLVAVLTDYIPHSYWVYDEVDYYIAPSEEVAERLAQKGVAENKIRVFGIPFDQEFNTAVDKDRVMHKLGLSPALNTVLIMGGGQGLGPVKTTLRYLAKIRRDFQVIAVCGSNKKLYKSLKRKAKKYKKRLVVFGYTDNIHELMGACDILITKPGGITTAEALVKKIPMVILKPIPGQEASNTAYLLKKQAVVKVSDPRRIGTAIENLLSNPAQLLRLREAAGRIAKPNSTLDIVRLSIGLCRRDV